MAVGGDWYDVLPLPDGRVGLVVGDVQGHSVEASAVMGQLRIALRAYAAEGHSPGTVLARTGRLLADLDTDLFATCCYLSLDPATGAIEAARAGHPLPVRIAGGPGTALDTGDLRTAVELDLPGGPPLGVDPQARYPETAAVLAPGETLLLYTDGLIECRGESIDTSLDRLLATVTDWTRGAARNADPNPGPDLDPLERLADHLVRPCQAQSPRADDVAVFLLERRS
jgi:serine phosphatase RsbU (regulator of sigma subunit)